MSWKLPCLAAPPQALVRRQYAAAVILLENARHNIDGTRQMGLHRAPWMAGVAQLVERQVVVLDAVGSSPIARPIPFS